MHQIKQQYNSQVSQVNMILDYRIIHVCSSSPVSLQLISHNPLLQTFYISYSYHYSHVTSQYSNAFPNNNRCDARRCYCHIYSGSHI